MQHIITEIARQYGTTPESVRAEIDTAIRIGMTHADKTTQEQWEKVPHLDDVPTAEELICYLAILTRITAVMP